MIDKNYLDDNTESVFSVVGRMIEPFCCPAGFEKSKLINSDEIEELMKLFFQIIKLPKATQFEGIDNLVDSITMEFSPDCSFSSAVQYFSSFAKVEAIVKHFIYLLKPEKWDNVVNNKKMLAWCLTCLGLIPSINDPDCIDLNEVTPENVYDTPKPHYPYLDHIVRARDCRNNESHHCPKQTRYELVLNEVSLWITYLYIIKSHKNEFYNVLEKEQLQGYSRVEYCRSYIKEYENINKDFRYYPFKWRNDKEENDVTIEKTMLSDSNRILLYGEAGSGKSVALQYLCYIAAKNHVSNENAPIPVFIELKSLKGQTIHERISSELSFAPNECTNILEKGHILLFLDGLNEIVSHDPNIKSIQVRHSYVEQIKELFNNFPKTRIWLSDRAIPNFGTSTKGVFEPFEIQKMTKEDILAFCKEYQLDSKLLSSLNLDSATVAFLNTPFKIKMFSDLISEKGIIPSSTEELIDQYLKMIIRREWEEKGTLNIQSANVFFKLLENFSVAIKKNQYNSLNFTNTFNVFSNVLEQYGESKTETQACMNIAVELKILEKSDNDYYEFASEQYRSYFITRFMSEQMEG